MNDSGYHTADMRSTSVERAVAPTHQLSPSSSSEDTAEAIFQAVKTFVHRHTAAAIEAAIKPLRERVEAADARDVEKSATIMQLQTALRQLQRKVAVIEVEKRL